MNKRNKRITSYFIMFSLIIIIGVAFAILQANLQINGTAKISENQWNVHFENIVVNPESVPIGTGDTAATIDPINNCKVDFSVTLSLPGDFYEFTVDAKNDGTIDAMIGTLTKSLKVNNVETETVPEYLIYTVTYEDGVEILENHMLAKGTKETYKVRVEFKTDIDAEDLPDTTTLSMTVEPTYVQADENAEKVKHWGPVLDDGMIPVTIANDGTVTTVTEDDDTWFNYDNKTWANAVLVKETGVKTRAQNKVAGTVINQDDILAYFVWIPRYSYKIWTLDASQAHTGDEQTIDIKFVDKNTKENGSAVGDYYTHPAFTFGTEELSGIWVGKFEMSHNTLSSSTKSNNLSCTTETCTNASGLRVLPNVSSIRYNNVSNMWYATRSMEQSNNVFGITNSDSHMMKNSEWGAVAYLSHSNYGINDEIRINNYRKDTTTYATLTGCGASAANANVATTCGIAYGNASSYPQSTTGNISGIFDMSGGAWEYVMGNYNNTIGSSGFSTLPNAKYYDVYLASQFTGDFTTNMTFCTLETCGGHALNETRAWYSDYAYFVDSGNPWFVRGGHCNNSQGAGAFNSGSLDGSAHGPTSWRGVFAAR